MSSKLMHGSSILTGDNTIPGVTLSKELKEYIPIILQACKDWGLDFYPTVVEKLHYDEISEIAAYGGFPVRYPHWRWGMEYEELQRGYIAGMHKIYEMVVNCLGVSTKVLTKRGTIRVDEVKVGDKLCLGDGERNVVAVKRQKPSRTKKIKLRDYNQDLVCTYNHKWKVLSLNGLEWKCAEDIIVGDIIVGDNPNFYNTPFKLNWCKDNVLESTNLNVRNRLKEISPPHEMTLELAELLGIIVGDGSNGVKRSENNVYVTVGKENLDYAKHVQNLFSIVLGVKPTIQEKPSCYVVFLCSKYAVDFFDYCGIKRGCTFKDKIVPRSIWESSNEFRGAFIKGLFDTDGYASKVLGFSAFNDELASDVQLLFTELGIKTRFDTVPNGENFIHIVEVVGQPSLVKFKEKIGFYTKYKRLGLEKLIRRKYCRGGGMPVTWLQNKILEWAEKEGVNTYNYPSLGRSVQMMKRQKVGFNCLQSFVERASNSENKEIPCEFYEVLNLPMFEVEIVEEGDILETIDIALDHQAHDFLANGLVTHNTNPCYIYCLNSNALVDDLTVVAHATGHNDFFKNNIYFHPTSQNMMNQLANNGTRIRKYMERWGKEKVTEFIDHIMRIDTLIDPAKAWHERDIKDPIIKDERKYYQPRLMPVDKDRSYMDSWINTPEWRQKEKERIANKEAADEIDLFKEPQKDILGHIRDHAPLKPWQSDVVAMLHEEAMYFSPQRITKAVNEGWASFIDYEIMARQGYVSLGQKGEGAGIVDYASHKWGVLGGKYSMNPYKLGFYLLLDIEERWNKGRFGQEWEDCKNMKLREGWDTNAGLGKEKIFEVRKYYNDFTMISEFFTEEFCHKYEFYEWKRFSNGEYKIASRDYKKIKKKLMQKYINGGLPDVRLVDDNYRGAGIKLLQHYPDEVGGRELYRNYVANTLPSLYFMYKKPVVLSSYDKNGDEILYICNTYDPSKVKLLTREEFEEIGFAAR